MFTSSKAQSRRYFLACLFALTILFVDYRLSWLKGLRFTTTFITSPIQIIVDYPVRFYHSITALFAEKKRLIDENIQLKYEYAKVAAALQKFRVIYQENTELKALLNVTHDHSEQALMAQIMAVDTNHIHHLLTVNRGMRDGVYKGQVAIDAHGVMGQVIEVGAFTSTIMLISDVKSGIPVRNNRTGDRAIINGNNKMDDLTLQFMPQTADIKVKDLLVTSGLGQKYPEGYPVGSVSGIQKIPGEDFLKIKVVPNAALNQSRIILLLKGSEQAYQGG